FWREWVGNSMWEFPGMAQQSDGAFAPALSPGSPLMSPQLPPAPPAPGYQSPEVKSWNNGVFGQAPAAAAAPAGMYNNMSITVSMGGSGGSGAVPGMAAMAGGIPMNSMMAGMNSMCSEQV
ncbi:NCOA1 protein, partial [Poecile atricapillus]|nr:NCOA1 protein [Poecile atricapillus]